MGAESPPEKRLSLKVGVPGREAGNKQERGGYGEWERERVLTTLRLSASIAEPFPRDRDSSPGKSRRDFRYAVTLSPLLYRDAAIQSAERRKKYCRN